MPFSPAPWSESLPPRSPGSRMGRQLIVSVSVKKNPANTTKYLHLMLSLSCLLCIDSCRCFSVSVRGREVISEDRKTLSVVSVSRDTDLSVYQCEGRNQHGVVYADNFLNILRKLWFIITLFYSFNQSSALRPVISFLSLFLNSFLLSLKVLCSSLTLSISVFLPALHFQLNIWIKQTLIISFLVCLLVCRPN